MTKNELQEIRKEVDKEVNKTIDVVFARLEANLDTPKLNTTNSSDSSSNFILHWSTMLFVTIIIFGDALIVINGREFIPSSRISILILLAFNFGCFLSIMQL